MLSFICRRCAGRMLYGAFLCFSLQLIVRVPRSAHKIRHGPIDDAGLVSAGAAAAIAAHLSVRCLRQPQSSQGVKGNST
jgi:hypothetical protein